MSKGKGGREGEKYKWNRRVKFSETRQGGQLLTKLHVEHKFIYLTHSHSDYIVDSRKRLRIHFSLFMPKRTRKNFSILLLLSPVPRQQKKRKNFPFPFPSSSPAVFSQIGRCQKSILGLRKRGKTPLHARPNGFSSQNVQNYIPIKKKNHLFYTFPKNNSARVVILV